MQFAEDGLQWQILLLNQRIWFRHDGRGSVSMRTGLSRWRPVPVHWHSDATLCWGELCARGEIPLD